jgi:sensor domain CHASE-containing protein
MADATPRMLVVELPVVEFVDREVAHLRELHTLRFELAGKAIELNHVETLRRLDELNHAHAQNMIDKQDYLPRQMFEQFESENQKWREGVNGAINSAAGSNRTLILIVGFVLTALGIVLKVWK